MALKQKILTSAKNTPSSVKNPKYFGAVKSLFEK